MLLGSADAPGGPIAVVGIGIVHHIIHDAGDIHAGAKKFGLIGHRNQCEKSAVTQAPHTDTIRIYIRQRLQIVGAHPGVLRVFSSHIHVDTGAPIAAIADASAIVGGEDHVTFLEKILMNAVVHGVVSLDVPAVIVLIHAIAVNPEDGGMFFCAVEIFGHE